MPGRFTTRSLGRVWSAGTLTYTSAGLAILFCWLLWGDFAWSMKDRTVGPVLQLLLKKFGASDTLTGIMLGSLPLAVSVVLSPIISYKSDHHRGRWGRRIPFLLIPTPVAVLAMVGLAFSPVLGAQLHHVLGTASPGLDSSTLLLLGLFWTLFEVATIIANSVFGALINDVVPQQVLGRFYGLFRALSLIAGILFNFWLFGKADTAYAGIFLGMGLLYGGGFSMMCLNVKEGQYPPPPPPNPNRNLRTFLLAVREYLRKCFGIPYYWWFYGATALAGMAFMPFNLFCLYYARELEIGLPVYARYTALTYFTSLVLAYPLGVLADRFHPLRLSLLVQVVYVITTLAAGFYVHDSTTFGLALLIHGVMSGTWMTASASLALKILPKDNFAQFASAGGIVGSLGGIVVGPCVGLFLDYIGHVYRCTLFISGGLGAVGLMVGYIFYRQFLARGGATPDYVAPE
jgi:MFS family permease